MIKPISLKKEGSLYLIIFIFFLLLTWKRLLHYFFFFSESLRSQESFYIPQFKMYTLGIPFILKKQTPCSHHVRWDCSAKQQLWNSVQESYFLTSYFIRFCWLLCWSQDKAATLWGLMQTFHTADRISGI